MENETLPPHIPVLPSEVLHYAMPASSGVMRVIDGTVGFGGHSSLMLKKNPDALLLGLDRDSDALSFASKRLEFAGSRVKLVRSDFSRLAEAARSAGWEKVDSILLDIGVSSYQIDTPERGFSFRFDAPLDMRMDTSESLDASAVVNTYPERELFRVFREYGELREASRLARAIVSEREKQPVTTCKALADICTRVLERGGRRTGPPSPTLVFQALRIEVNDELGELRCALEGAREILSENGRLCVISFHSLEDRIVKRFLVANSRSCLCPPSFPVCMCGGNNASFEILTKKPVEASESEVALNSRSACAKLRCALRINVGNNNKNKDMSESGGDVNE